MQLTKLELQGFKSFADNTVLEFEPGVTAIVGPNGCGKSNVSDAVRWVLGEQRARLLRGAKMEEVIFQGSSARRAVNVAEVSLHFSNDEGILPVPFKEVVITRRLSRSGDSEYFLNRAPCRLRDIADLLRGTGLGADTGVVIESKMIDALLSDRPDDRRELFEEAAGVGLYRDRRRTTERRLEETMTDLQRLDDLINEVQSQVRSLARQRKRAERYSEITTRRFTVEIALAAREMAAWAEELGRLELRVAELREAQPLNEEAMRNAEQAREGAHAARAAAEAHRAELGRLVASQREGVQRIRAEMAVAEERQRNALARRQRAETEAGEGAAHGERLAMDREHASTERVRLDEELGTAREAMAQAQRADEEARQLVSAARGALDVAERALRELHDRVRRHDHERERAQRELDEVSQRHDTLELERRQLAEALELVRSELAESQVALEGARAAFAGAQDALREARESDRATREEEAGARGELFRADEALTSLQGKVNALEALERERVGLAPAAARLLKEREQFAEGSILGPLSDFISADQGSALLVERFLGATVHAVIVRDRAAADEIRSWHHEANPGPLLLLPLDALTDEMMGQESHGVLAELVQAAGPGRNWVKMLLGHVEAVDNGSAFVDARGAVWLPGTTAGPGPLRRRAELYSLRSELAAAEGARAVASARADELRAALQASELRVNGMQEAANESQQGVTQAQEHFAQLERRSQRAERELQEAVALGERLVTRRNELQQRIASLDEESAAVRVASTERETELVTLRAQLTEVEGGQEHAREFRTQAQVSVAEAQARLEVASDRARRLEQEFGNAAQRLQALHAELSELSQADATLAEQMQAWQMDLDARTSALADGEHHLSDAEAGVVSADEALTVSDHALDEARRRGTMVSEELHSAELRYTELSGRRTAIRERLETEWRKPLDEMLATHEPVDMDDASLRGEAEALRQQLETLGPVNVLAIEEHDEQVRRLEFLTTQRADLFDARAQLQQAIREIDVQARELFLATFNQVRENFRQIFMSLFGGGECDLRLENPDTPLDCDIEIHASPRGKRTQRIHLLSSGERALVALSLLFGIFLTKPSPFCLLDEVDAPLDDANVGRFVRMLTEFKQRTQFIVITHNPRTTTEAADAVYGVTMQEPGVSSLVSVRMRGQVVEGINTNEAVGAGA
ncbi:MAG: chromosome segregation protein [Gemmatimonadetes bacterium]|nr:chromosome segregation protein [Gemmatimonadota bacterium]